MDTGWIVRSFRGVKAYDQTILKIGAPQLAISVMSVAELYEGAFRAANPVTAEQSLMRFLADKAVLPITVEIGRLFGEQRARLRQRNELIGDADLLIAATCLHHDLTLLTTNRAHFQRVPGLRIISRPLP